MISRLDRSALPVESVALARFLIGRFVLRDLDGDLVGGRIVETEAYLPGDAACHAFRGRTARNASLFLRHGHAYVYRAYGTSWMLNVSSEPEGIGAGVLLRAIEPMFGLDQMRRRRGEGVPDRDFARGPGRLAQALGVDRTLDGRDLTGGGCIWLAEDRTRPALGVGVSLRIGITKDADRPLRFFALGSRFVSGPAWLNRAQPEAACAQPRSRESPRSTG